MFTKSLIVLAAVAVAAVCVEEGFYGNPEPVFYEPDGEDPAVAGVSGKYKVAEKNWPKYGVPYRPSKEHFASYYERAAGTWLNYIRIAPVYFRDTYLKKRMTSGDSSWKNVFNTGTKTYPSVAPGFWHLNLNRVARAHCWDQAKHCYKKPTYHSDCNGTDVFSSNGRFAKYLGQSYGAEIYSHYSEGSLADRAFTTMISYVCDGYHTLNAEGSLSKCVKDKSGDGHREIIMKWCAQWGCGYEGADKGLDYGTAVHTCDCISSATTKYKGRRIAAAAHVAVPTARTTKYMYVVTVSGTGTTAPVLYVNNAKKTLTKKYKGKAGYVYESAYFTISASAPCSYYYFKLGSERYPATGTFGTYAIGKCKVDYKA